VRGARGLIVDVVDAGLRERLAERFRPGSSDDPIRGNKTLTFLLSAAAHVNTALVLFTALLLLDQF
jgi:hypothetical protein